MTKGAKVMAKKQLAFYREIRKIVQENRKNNRLDAAKRKAVFMTEVLPTIQQKIREEAVKDNSVCEVNIPLIYSNAKSEVLDEYMNWLREGLAGFDIQLCSRVCHEYYCEIRW